jgi:hypothetical protein
MPEIDHASVRRANPHPSPVFQGMWSLLCVDFNQARDAIEARPPVTPRETPRVHSNGQRAAVSVDPMKTLKCEALPATRDDSFLAAQI